jgi:hypothetical protein
MTKIAIISTIIGLIGAVAFLMQDYISRIELTTEPTIAFGAQNTFFNDTFTTTTDGLLENHVPDTGTGWTEILQIADDSSITVDATAGVARPTNTGFNDGSSYSADATYSTSTYQLEYTCVDCGHATNYLFSFIRANSNLSSGYIFWDTTDASSDDAVLSLVTSQSTCSQLDIIDEGEVQVALFPNNTTIQFQSEVVGSNDEIIVFASTTGWIYATTSVIGQTGKAGMGIGALPCDLSGDINSTNDQRFDNFSVYELADTRTGWNDPTTTGEVSNSWTDPTNAYSSNDSDATEATNGEAQDYGDFGFSIPAGDTIRGIMVRIEANAGTNGRWDELGVEVSNDNGATWSSRISFVRFFSTTDDYRVAGHGRYLWGLSWTPTDVSDTDFRVRLTLINKEFGSNAIGVDHVSVKVFHDAGEGGEPEAASPPPVPQAIITD